MRTKSVGIVVFDRVATLDVTGPCDTFAMARAEDDCGMVRPAYEVSLLAVKERKCVSESGVSFKADHLLNKGGAPDIIIIPGGMGLRDPEVLRTLSDWLVLQASRGAIFAAINGGISGLAASGLLDRRHVTTHWRYGQEIARKYPSLHLKSSASFVKDGPFYTCSSSIAAIEMCVALIEDDYGAEVALGVARELVVQLRPPGDDEDRAQVSSYQSGPTERMAELPMWIANHLQDDLSVAALARRTRLCPRHFGRVFKHVFHQTPANFVEELRLSEAKRALLVPRNTVAMVATSVGFKSSDAFRRAFERRFGISPSGFRSRFAFRANTTHTQNRLARVSVSSLRKVEPVLLQL